MTFVGSQPVLHNTSRWHAPHNPQTTAYGLHLRLQLVNATIEEVSLKERLFHDVALGVIEWRIASQVAWTCCPARGVLGLDEIALKIPDRISRSGHLSTYCLVYFSHYFGA